MRTAGARAATKNFPGWNPKQKKAGVIDAGLEFSIQQMSESVNLADYYLRETAQIKVA
jgi:hypothetical protein